MMTEKYLKNSKSLVSRQIQIKEASRVHIAPVRLVKSTNNPQHLLKGKWKKWNPNSLFVGLNIGSATREICVANSKRAENKSTT